MSVDIPRLFASSFNARATGMPVAWMIGFKLWCRGWHQVPAASLPSSDEELCHLAELGLDLKTFRKAKALALHGWIACDDGRLYHPVIAEYALVAWLEKLQQRAAGAKGNKERWNTPFDPVPLEADIKRAERLLHALSPQHKALAKSARRSSQREQAGVAK